MKNERFLTPSTFALVAFLHIGLMALLWQGRPLPLIEMETIEFVDLSGFGGGDGQAEGAGAPAPETAAPPEPKPKPEPPKPKEAPKPQPKPKPAETPKQELKPVITQKAQADISKPKETLKPKPVEKAKPEPAEQPKPVERPVEKAVEKPVEKLAAPPAEKTAENAADKPAAGPVREKGGSGDGTGYAKIQGKGSGSGSGEGRGTGKGEGSGSKTGSGSGSGEIAGGGAGSSAGNPVKGVCSVRQPSEKDYPQRSQENGEEGSVTFIVTISPSNQITNIKIIKSSGFPSLDRAAKNLVRKYPCDSKGKWYQGQGTIVFALP